MDKVIDWDSLSHEELVEVVKYLYRVVERMDRNVGRLDSIHAVYGGVRYG